MTVLAILGLLFDPVEGQIRPQSSRPDLITISPMLHLSGISPQLEDSFALGDDVSSISMMISEYFPLHLHLIYDRHYKDAMVGFDQISPGIQGMTITAFEEADIIWRYILEPVADESMIVLLCSPKHILETFQLMIDLKLKTMEAIWLVILKNSDEEIWVLQRIEDLVLEGTRLTLLTRISSGIYRISTSFMDPVGGSMRIRRNAVLNLNTKNTKNLQNLPEILFTDVKDFYSNMKGRQMKVAINSRVLFAEIVPQPDGENPRYQGMEFAMLDIAKQKFNFTYVVVKAVNNAWGNLNPDGTATGMIGMVYRREVDFAMSTITVTRSRSRAVDFTVPFFMDSLSILTKAPTIENPTFIAFSPFTIRVWLCIVATALLIGPILKLLSKMTEVYFAQGYLGSLQIVSFSIFRSMVVQGNLLKTSTWSQRTILAFWYLFCMVVSALYSGTLIGMLAIPSYEKPVNSLLDLPRAVRNGYMMGVRRHTMQESLFKNAKEGIYKDTWQLFNHDDLSKNLLQGSEGYDLVTIKKMAFIAPRIITEAEITGRGRSLYHISRESFFNKWLAWACTQGAPFRKSFDLLILRMIGAGLVGKWKDDEFRRLKKIKVKEEKSGPQAIKLIYLQAAFYVLLLGILVSTIVFIIEKTWIWLPCFDNSSE